MELPKKKSKGKGVIIGSIVALAAVYGLASSGGHTATPQNKVDAETSITTPATPEQTTPVQVVPETQKIAPSQSSPAPTPASTPASCGSGYYLNVDGNCVPTPRTAPSVPEGATAECNDGTYSFSQNRRGTCSHHGGVARWL